MQKSNSVLLLACTREVLSMKKYKNLLLFSTLMLLLGSLCVLMVCFWDRIQRQTQLIGITILLVGFVWACGSILLLLTKKRQGKALSKLLAAGNAAALGLLLVFACFYALAANHPHTDGFSVTTELFDNKNVMIVVPHQDDDINLMGSLIGQYTQGNSNVTVVFSTNGDGDLANADIRAAEAVSVLSAFGVKQENIYFLGFGDLWQAQEFDGTSICHIYNSPDPDAVWTSAFGATSTYGTRSIPCYQELPYTRNNYLNSFAAIIQEKQPEIIFAVDFDTHIDHKATDLFFEEALCNVLRANPRYHPTVYKGFCYGTAWKADEDFYGSLNLLSTKMPDTATWKASAFGYAWEDRLRFPESAVNLNPMLLNNSVYHAFNGYGSQFAYIRAEAVLNGDKVFWERRTDSLLYDADISVNGETCALLNDFKLKDFADIGAAPDTGSGVAFLTGKTVRVNLGTAVTASCIYLYDNPSQTDNILSGCITFDDGSELAFGPLNEDGSSTVISFPEREIAWFEIVPTGTEGDRAGLSEIEFYGSAPDLQEKESFLMAVDADDNFVYDHRISGGDTAALKLYRFPYSQLLGSEDVELSFASEETNNSCRWEGDTLLVTCAPGSSCTITVSADGNTTTFTVSNPTALSRGYLSVLRGIEKLTVEIRYLVFCLYQVYYRITG